MLNFETTQWTLVLAAGEQSSPPAREALEKLCEKYWQPLYEYAMRRTRDEATAGDSVQAFITWLIEKDFFKAADAERGKFRSFLIVSFKRFLNKQHVYATTQKRGGGQPVLSFDRADEGDRKLEPADTFTAEQEFQRQWARTILEIVMQKLQEDYGQQDKLQQFQQLKPFIAREEGQKYQAVAEKLGINAPAARMAASRLRDRFRVLLRQEIAQTVSREEEVDEEIQDLFQAFQAS
jgi:RNA polymerase sigma factor (sigma-70 family)